MRSIQSIKFGSVSINRTVLLFMLICTASTLFGQTKDSTELRMTPPELSALKPGEGHAPGSSNLNAVQVIVVFGDPAKPGLYTILLKVAANTRVPAHLHPDHRIGSVVSGLWYFGYGDKFDEASLKRLEPGSIYSEVSNKNHFAMTGKEPVIVAITGYGPSGVTYVNPADDPVVPHQ